MSGKFESIIYLIYFRCLPKDESHPYPATALGHCRCLHLLRWISSPFPLPSEILFRRRSALWIASVLISVYFQRILIVGVNVCICKSRVYLEIFFFLSNIQGQNSSSSCPLQNLTLAARGMVAISPLTISKDDHCCADKHFFNVFLLQLTFFLQYLINSWRNSENWKLSSVVAFSC